METASQIIFQGGTSEITEKKSRFIATVAAVHTEEEAKEVLSTVRKKYHDARHHCYAYVLEKASLQKCSDDGEPAGTAGRPILEQLEIRHLTDALLIVTRYFGGTLLGKSGLIRAYQEAAVAGLTAARILTKRPGMTFQIQLPYAQLKAVEFFCQQRGIFLLDRVYLDTVTLTLLVEEGQFCAVEKGLTEITSGKVLVTEKETCWYVINEGQAVLC